MFERDYIMKLLADFIQALLRSMTMATKEENPYAAARSIEIAIGNAVDMDAAVFLAMEPESMAMMMGISSMDENGGEYIARSLALASVYNRAAGDTELADFRMAQAHAVAESYGCELGELDFDADVSVEEATRLMQEYLDEEDIDED